MVTKTCTVWSPQILWQPKQHSVTIAIDDKKIFWLLVILVATQQLTTKLW
jgi:hypothetical protein